MAGYIGSKANVSQIDGYVKSEVDTLLGQELNLSGGSMTGHLNFGDNIKIQSGAGTDLQIYHDASNSYIKDAGTGSLRLSATTIELMKVDTSELMASFAQDGAVTLYYDNAAKLATASGGITITGNASFADNGKAIFGGGSDLQIYHDGLNSYIEDTGTGSLIIEGTNLVLRADDGSRYLQGVDGASGVTRLYHPVDDAIKLSTTATGIDVTGTVTADGLTVDAANSTFNGAVGITSAAGAGISEGLLIDYSTNLARFLTYDSTTGSEIAMYTQPSGGSTAQRLRINSGGDISFYEDTGTTAKLVWDAAAESLTVNGDVNIDDAIPILRLDSPATTWSGGEDLGGLDWYTKDTSGNGPGVIARIYSESSGTNTTPVPNMIFQTSVAVSLKDRMKISGTGDISFYEDTGTTAKFFWDASTERLGIGTSLPSRQIHLASSVPSLRLEDTDVSGLYGEIVQLATGDLSFRADHGNVQASSSMSFSVDGSQAMTIDSSGHAIIPAGVTLGTSVGVYNAANTLDDYEEGTWTVEMYDAASGGNASSSQITGRYTKIGQQVIASFFALNNVSTSGLTSGNTVYFTLPFAASSTGRACGSCHLDAVTFPTGTTMITPSVSNSNSRAQLSASGSAAGDTTVKVSSFNGTSSDVVNWTLSYRTDS